MNASDPLPRWDLSNIYSGLEGDDYRAALAKLAEQLAALERQLDELGIRRLPQPPPSTPALADTLEKLLKAVNDLSRQYETLEAFVHGYFTTNSYDPVAGRETSKIDLLSTRRQKIGVRLRGWIGSLGPALEATIAKRPPLANHGYFLREAVRLSKYLMSDEMEGLAAELCVDGGVAFGKLQGSVTSQLKVPFEKEGKAETLPITVIRNLSFDPDPEIRERAYRAELAGWTSIRTSVAASLNAVKGTASTLARRRGRESVLAAALDDNQIDRATLDAMLGAIREALPMFRRYFAAKARKMGLDRLRWWDLFAPVGKIHLKFTWDEARQFIVDKFSKFNADLGRFADAAFAQRWIDALPRDGKRGGAFCMSVIGVEESRILCNFDGSFEQTSTVAHELGHGYHNYCQKGLEPLRRGSPMVLAETASIFCETLIAEGAIAETPPSEHLPILETQLIGASQVCVDILSRFIFESAVCERRPTAELSADELCELMTKAQAETYGEAVDPDTYHPYMWLWKPHYYQFAENFYNYPYAFGHLFGLGLYSIYQRDGEKFVPRYNELLRSTAQAAPAELAARFGLDIRRSEFWQASLKVIGDQVERYAAL